MRHWYGNVTDENNRHVAGASIKVYTSAAIVTGSLAGGDLLITGDLADIYSDDGFTAIDQDGGTYLTTDSVGWAEFWVDAATVVLGISFDGELKRVVTDVEVDGSGTAVGVGAGPITGGDLTMSTARILGRTTSGSGAIEEITVGDGLTLSGGSLTATYAPGGTDVAVADGGTGASTAAGARTNLSAAALTQTLECIAGFIASPSNKSYTLVVKAPHGGTITETTTVSASGTITATFKINSTALGGTANSVSSSEQSQAHASSNVFAAGDDIVLTGSANSSCADMSFTIKYTRVLE